MDNIKYLLKKILYKNYNFNSICVAAAATNKDTFLAYKNLCNGTRDVVVCGAGPTLQKYIPVKDAVHIAVNRAFMYDKVDFDFIFAQDMDGIRMVKDELRSYKVDTCVKLLAVTSLIGEKTIPESYALQCNAKRFYMDNDIYCDGYKSKMVLDLDKRPLGGMPNVGMSVIQFALYMNPRKLYIVGCDMTGTHFTEGHQTKEQLGTEKKQYTVYWNNNREKLINKWNEIKEFASVYYPDTEIISVNPVGLKGLFKDWNQY